MKVWGLKGLEEGVWEQGRMLYGTTWQVNMLLELVYGVGGIGAGSTGND